MNIDTSSEEYALYKKLTTYSKGNKVIGSGEAASIVLAKKCNGILKSNNLKDIKYYIDKYSLKHLTRGQILVEALERGFITEQDGNTIWASMVK